MAENKVTLRDLFLNQAGELDFSFERVDQISALKGEIELIPGIACDHVFEEFQIEIGKILDVGFDDILLGAWKKYRELQQYTDTNKYPPEEVALVPLVEQTITSTHRPYIDVFVNENRVGHIVFTVSLQLKLKGIVLKIQGGKIREVKAGTCDGEGSLNIGSVPVVEGKLISFDLPGVIALTKGVEIPNY
jgi:hypothetical protein